LSQFVTYYFHNIPTVSVGRVHCIGDYGNIRTETK